MVYILSLQNGDELWSYEIGSFIANNAAVMNGRIVIGAGDGNIYCFEN